MANGLNDQSVLDTRQVISGKDGQLFITDEAGVNHFMAQVQSFQAVLNVTNTDYQPVGSALQFAVNIGYNITLTLTETVVDDRFLLEPFLNYLKQGRFPYFEFVGKFRRADGMAERVVYKNCIADGSVDLQNLVPGEIVTRAWNFRVNAAPDLLESFSGIAGLPSDYYSV